MSIKYDFDPGVGISEDDILESVKQGEINNKPDKDDNDTILTGLDNDGGQGDEIEDDNIDDFLRSFEENDGKIEEEEEEEEFIEDEESGEEEEETEEEEEETDTGENEDEDEDDDYEPSILDVLREEQLLIIPEDFDGELDSDTLEQFKEQTRIYQAQQILNDLRNQYAGDDYSLRVFDHFLNGGSVADLPKYTKILDEIQSYENYDISDENSQRQILIDFYKEGLDANSPSYSEMVEAVTNKVDKIIEEDLNGERKAKEARQYFVQKAQTRRQQEEQRVAEENRRIAQREAERMQREQYWHNQFVSTLQNRKWSQDKKQSIYREQYATVRLQDGSEVPTWYAKEMMIKSNPELHQIYLDWLNNSFDLNKGSFKEKTDPKTEVTRTILKMAKKKDKRKRRSQSGARNTSNEQKRILIDPLENL